MWNYEKRLQYPVNITTPNAKLAQFIMSQYGGPDGEIGASMRYLSQRFTMPNRTSMAVLNDIGTEELAHKGYQWLKSYDFVMILLDFRVDIKGKCDIITISKCIFGIFGIINSFNQFFQNIISCFYIPGPIVGQKIFTAWYEGVFLGQELLVMLQFDLQIFYAFCTSLDLLCIDARSLKENLRSINPLFKQIVLLQLLSIQLFQFFLLGSNQSFFRSNHIYPRMILKSVIKLVVLDQIGKPGDNRFFHKG